MSVQNLQTVSTQGFDYSNQAKLPTLSNVAVDVMKGRIGRLINPLYENGAWTPEQKWRAGVITTIALTALATIALIIIRSYFAIPLGIASIAITVIYYKYKEPDLNSPKERHEIIKQLMFKNLDDLNASFNITEIVGYKLCESLKPFPVNGNKTECAEFYVQLEELLKAFNAVKNSAGIDTQKIHNAFEQDTVLERIEYNQRLSHAQNRQTNGSMLQLVGGASMGNRRSLVTSVAGGAAAIYGTIERQNGLSDQARAEEAFQIKTEQPRKIRDNLLKTSSNEYEKTVAPLRIKLEDLKKGQMIL